MPTQFDTVSMPELSQNTAVAKGLRNTNDGNPLGDQVDNTAGDNPVAPKAQGLSSGSGSDLNMYSRPSWLCH